MGGTSAINNNYFVRGSPHDYDRWEELGARGWAYDDVKRYFSNFEDARSLNGSNPLRGRGGEVKISYAYQTPFSPTHFKAAQEAGNMRLLSGIIT